jgi:hypothetical protein
MLFVDNKVIKMHCCSTHTMARSRCDAFHCLSRHETRLSPRCPFLAALVSLCPA